MALRRRIGFGYNVVIFFETHVEKIEDKIEWNKLQSINKLKKHARSFLCLWQTHEYVLVIYKVYVAR